MLEITEKDAEGLFDVKKDLLVRGASSECPFDHHDSKTFERFSGKNYLVCLNKCKILFPTLDPSDCPCDVFSTKYNVAVINKCLKGNGYDIKTGKKVI